MESDMANNVDRYRRKFMLPSLFYFYNAIPLFRRTSAHSDRIGFDVDFPPFPHLHHLGHERRLSAISASLKSTAAIDGLPIPSMDRFPELRLHTTS
jgi:hypothetical protein